MKHWIAVALLLPGLARAGGTARVEVSDIPNWQDQLFRYVTWNGENYSPDAFVAVAKNRDGIEAIELADPTTMALACIASIVHDWPIPASYVDARGERQSIAPSDAPMDITCKRAPPPKPDITLPEGYVRLVDGREGIAVEGEPLSTGKALVKRLKRGKIRGVVVEDLSIRGMICIGPVAREARVRIANVSPSGRLEHLRISGGDIKESCEY